MKISTEQEFWSFADNWYQRTKRLAEIWQTDESEKRRRKAFYLWSIMFKRMEKVTQKAIEMNKHIHPKNQFPKGGTEIKEL